MKAIDILFDKVNELNQRMMETNDRQKKIIILTEMECIIKTIYQIGEYSHDYSPKEYI